MVIDRTELMAASSQSIEVGHTKVCGWVQSRSRLTCRPKLCDMGIGPKNSRNFAVLAGIVWLQLELAK
jgi:hypothetical protein